MRKFLAVGPIAAVVAGLFLVASAASATPPPAVHVELLGTATLVSGGTAIDVPLTVTCHPRFTVLEANLSLSQNGASGFTGFAVPRCTNQPQTVTVRVTSFGDPFEAGAAFASAFVLVIERAPSGQTRQDQDVATIEIGA